MIADVVQRDLPFYDPTISPQAVRGSIASRKRPACCRDRCPMARR